MRNLKKLLALVLAMVMACSLMLTASAVDVSKFTDKDQVTPEFLEAVSVLSGLDVIKGDGDENSKTFRPQDDITRAEAAALVYRIVTGDVTDRQVQLYSDYGKFSDVKSDDWFAGYVGYCQNAGIIKGTTPTTFSPYVKVTGYEVLAMILRAVGYGKNNEFTGAGWQVNVASLGKTKHITDSISSAQYNYTLNMYARREIVAELLFRGSLIPQVTWSSALGYNEYTSTITVTGTKYYNNYLALDVFGLTRTGWQTGEWGRPQIIWKATLNPSKNRTVATLKATPSKTFYGQDGEKRECDIAEMMEFSGEKEYILYVNNKVAVTNEYLVKATDTVTKVGGYGRLVEIYTQEDMNKQYPYYEWWSYWNTANNATDATAKTPPEDTIVMIDTYLAKVISTTEPVLDAAGHVITPARLIVDLYDNTLNNPSRRTIRKSDDTSWDFSAGDVISLKGKSATGGTKDEQWAFTLPTVQPREKTNDILDEDTHVFDLTLLEGVQGKQTTVYWNQNKHQVDGVEKTDDLALRMDKAGSNINTTYTWYYDQYGFLLGIDDGSKSTYGVITSVYVSYGTTESANTDGVAKAIATVKYADGTTGTETIDYFMVNWDGSNTWGSSTGTAEPRKIDYQMTSTANTLQLWPAYNMSDKDPMQEEYGAPYAASNNSSSVCAKRGTVYMAPVAASNSQAALNNSGDDNLYGILYNNLFKFVTTSGDKTVAVEVAGGNNTDSAGVVKGQTGFNGTVDNSATVPNYTAPSGNEGEFAGHWAVKSDTTNNGKVYKKLAYITTDSSTAATNANVVAWLDEDTQIMIRDESTGSIACYDGVSALPGDVLISTSPNNLRWNEIDWADTDSDGRADVVFLTGRVDGVTTYGLFYSNNGTAQWNGSTGTISGFLNGEQETLVFNSLTEFNKIKDAVGYDGHLFAVKQVGGVVTSVMLTDWTSLGLSTNPTAQLIPSNGSIVKSFGNGIAAANGVGISVDGTGSDDFKYGDGTDVGYTGTNPYTQYTEAVYYKDGVSKDGQTYQVAYNPAYNWSVLGGTITATKSDGTVMTYHLTPNSKIYGLGSGVVLAEGTTALEYLNHSTTNDVTIVYENGGGTATMSILELYIQTDPNITPSDQDFVAYPGRNGVRMPNVPGDVAAASAAATNTTRDRYLRGLPVGVYCSDIDLTYDQVLSNAWSGKVAADLLYFRFDRSSAATSATVVDTISISNSLGSEQVTVGNTLLGNTGGASWTNHYFAVDITGWAPGTYSYSIRSSTGSVLQSGTFTL